MSDGIDVGRNGQAESASGRGERLSESQPDTACLSHGEDDCEGAARFRALLEHCPAIAFLKDEQGRYVYANGSLQRLFRAYPDELLGRSDFDFFPEELAGQLRQREGEAVTQAQPIKTIEVVPSAEGEARTWLMVRFPIEDTKRHRLVGGVGIDLTEQKKLEIALAEQLAQARKLNAELAQANARLKELASTDGLTGLYNYRHFREAMASAYAFGMRRGERISVAMLDLDAFKAFNDAFGHQAGDDVLCQVAAALRASVRRYDLVARYGGEEFVVLLPSTDADGARTVGERMREAVEQQHWLLRPVTISVGLATSGEDLDDMSELVANADRALYHSKFQGRNRVTHAEDLPTRPSSRPALPPRSSGCRGCRAEPCPEEVDWNARQNQQKADP
jgi:diguanylate cyclase (GGDEF)-like protein/PAS domain S-box-containing protein